MKTKRTVKLISFIIFAFMVFQLIPGTFAAADGFNSHAQNSKAFLSSGLVHADSIYIGRENHKSSFQKVPYKNITTGLYQLCIVDISPIKFCYSQEPFDFRKVIRQTILHYFNGSKYKNNPSSI